MNILSCYFFFNDLPPGTASVVSTPGFKRLGHILPKVPEEGRGDTCGQLLQNDKAKGQGNNTESGVWRVCGQGDNTNQGKEIKIKVVIILPPI